MTAGTDVDALTERWYPLRTDPANDLWAIITEGPTILYVAHDMPGDVARHVAEVHSATLERPS